MQVGSRIYGNNFYINFLILQKIPVYPYSLRAAVLSGLNLQA